MNRHSAIRAALETLSLARAPGWLPAPPDAAGFVLTLHHVHPRTPKTFDPNALLAVTPEFLDRLLGHLAGAGWRFVSLEALLADRQAGGPKRIAVTLDDGYRNNAEHALPVFRKHRAPFTIFVCPGFTERTSELWWEALERIIAKAGEVPSPGEAPSRPLPTGTPAEKQRVFDIWRAWLTTAVDETRQRMEVRALAANMGLDLPSLAAELVMDWNELRAIAADPLCSIGAHTMTHPALARLPEAVAFGEIRESVERIETETGRRPRMIAFPYGYLAAAGEREATLAQKAGLAGSFTTRPGYIPTSGSAHGLPRISVNGLFQETRFLDVLLAPGLWAWRDRLKKLR